MGEGKRGGRGEDGENLGENLDSARGAEEGGGRGMSRRGEGKRGWRTFFLDFKVRV